MNTISVTHHAVTPARRGAALAAALLTRLMKWMDLGAQAGTALVLRRKETTRVAQAAALRRYAQQFVSTDPRVAADLMAAADRHERAE